MPEDAVRVTAGRPTRTGRTDGRGRRSGLPVPTEVIVFGVTVLAVLIAAAISDNFDPPVARGFVTALAFAYILSRGLVKRGTGDDGL